MATHLALSKKLIADISNVRQIPSVTICTDANNCYDKVAHHYTSLCSHYFSLGICYLLVLFRAIQSMKTNLCTVFGVSISFFTSEGQPFKGTGQCNGDSQALLLITVFN